MEHQQLADQADQRSIRTQVVPTNRAMITDRNDEALAVSVSSKDIVLDPKHILDSQTDTGNERWQSMANVLKIPLADVQHLIQSNAHKRFVYLARKV
ncbi:peptidoglycan synthase, partial [Klebsiella pneumoniae]